MRKAILAAALCCAGCATIVEGTTQNITVDVVPETGFCLLIREGQTIGASRPGNRIVEVSKSMNDITFDCNAPGYTPRKETLSSHLSAATVASFFLLDLGIVDAATGAWKKYPERITIVMQPEQKPLPRGR